MEKQEKITKEIADKLYQARENISEALELLFEINRKETISNMWYFYEELTEARKKVDTVRFECLFPETQESDKKE